MQLTSKKNTSTYPPIVPTQVSFSTLDKNYNKKEWKMLRSDFLSRQKELGKIKREKAIELADINISTNNTSFILILLIFPHLF